MAINNYTIIYKLSQYIMAFVYVIMSPSFILHHKRPITKIYLQYLTIHRISVRSRNFYFPIFILTNRPTISNSVSLPLIVKLHARCVKTKITFGHFRSHILQKLYLAGQERVLIVKYVKIILVRKLVETDILLFLSP